VPTESELSALKERISSSDQYTFSEAASLLMFCDTQSVGDLVGIDVFTHVHRISGSFQRVALACHFALIGHITWKELEALISWRGMDDGEIETVLGELVRLECHTFDDGYSDGIDEQRLYPLVKTLLEYSLSQIKDNEEF